MDDAAWKTQLSELLMLPPPRYVPDEVMRASHKSAKGGIFLVLILFLFSPVFIWGFFPTGFWKDWMMAVGEVKSTAGKVIAHEKTKLSINKRQVYRTTFEYKPEGASTNVASHSFSYRRDREAGNPVQVDYLKGSPATARIKGERQSPTGSFGLLVLLLPVIPLLILFFTWRTRRRNEFLLRDGELGSVKVEAVQPTNMSINKQLVHRITLSPQHEILNHASLVIKRHDPTVVALFREYQESGKPLRMLFDPAHPKRVLFPDAL